MYESVGAIMQVSAISSGQEFTGNKHSRENINNFIALAKDGFYDIVVEDNGPGIKDENRNRLFTPNFTTKSSGTGLGLAICRNILERCGGEISYSRSFSIQGACFTIRFPKNIAKS